MVEINTKLKGCWTVHFFRNIYGSFGVEQVSKHLHNCSNSFNNIFMFKI